MSAALDTLMMVFEGETGVKVPEKVLFLGARVHEGLKSWGSVVGWQVYKPYADEWESEGYERRDELGDESFEMVIGLPGKSKDEVWAMFGAGRKRLKPGGVMVMAMANTAGAARFEKQFAQAVGGVESIQKHKCRAFYAVEDGKWDEAVFEQWASFGEMRQVEGTGYVTTAGVFSRDHVDQGSSLLIEHLPAMISGRVADLGAGWGYLSERILAKCKGVKQLDLYEADARALACARKNLEGAEVEVKYYWQDVVAGLNEQYDSIVMNPPFHTGQDMDLRLGQGFLISAVKGLRRGGRLWLVANRQLPYEEIFGMMELSYRKLAEDSVFKVLMATKNY